MTQDNLLQERITELENRLVDAPASVKGKLIGNIAKYRAVIALERIAYALEHK